MGTQTLRAAINVIALKVTQRLRSNMLAYVQPTEQTHYRIKLYETLTTSSQVRANF